MKITKYEHACFSVEVDGQCLLVDPGKFTTDYEPTDNVIAIVVTHEHPDHFDPDLLAKIYDKNPDSILISLSYITAKMPDHKSKSVASGDKLQIGPFELEFFGGEHATIHHSIPAINNLGVFINNKLYYPGDSFYVPGRPVKVLALPIGGPWLKISEAMDFLVAVNPEMTFPTHDATLSEIGKNLANTRLLDHSTKSGSRYQSLQNGPLDI